MNPTPTHWLDATPGAPYRWTMLAAIAISAWYWFVKSKREPALLAVYIGALGGAFLGAKLAYLFAEGWRDVSLPDPWRRLLAGKSVIGGLLGGYAGVEVAKAMTGWRRPTGDAFALIVPLGIALGRVGCRLQGCCLGRPVDPGWLTVRDADGTPRWPASQAELAFQLGMFGLLLVLWRQSRFRDRLFFLYLGVYGVFRFTHEFVRDTPRMIAGITGYQLLALVAAAIGFGMLTKRGREMARSRGGMV